MTGDTRHSPPAVEAQEDKVLLRRRILEENIKYHDLYEAPIYTRRHLQFFDDEEVTFIRARVEECLGKPLPDAGRFLDVGTGAGRILLSLMKTNKVKNGWGCDVSLGLLKEARKNGESIGCDVNLVLCDGGDIPFSDNSFDLVGGGAILHHVPFPDRALREIYRVLRPGGTMFLWGEPSAMGHIIVDRLIVFPVLAIPKIIYACASYLRGKKKSYDERFVDVHSFSVGNIHGRMTEAGFRDIRILTRGFLRSIFQQVTEPFRTRLIRNKNLLRGFRKFERKLERVDTVVLGKILPQGIFTEILCSATKPS